MKSMIFKGFIQRWIRNYYCRKKIVIWYKCVKVKFYQKKFIVKHKSSNNELIDFELNQESDGTIRLMDLVPLFIDLSMKETNRTCIVDGVWIGVFIRWFQGNFWRVILNLVMWIAVHNCFFTTHDVLLMDQDLLRRDEMWITERTRCGSTRLIAF